MIKKIVPKFVISWYHLFLSFLGALRYGFPAKKMKVIGITGTNGKSTTIDLAHLVLEKTGKKVASASSIRFKIGQDWEENKLKMTMPGRFYLQRFLKKALIKGCKYVIIEVTSEGVLQHRHRFIDFDIAIFTNLSKEHIERHGSYEKYREAKGKFFKGVRGLHILNMDDENIGYFSQFLAEKKIGYSISEKSSNSLVVAKKVQVLQKGVSFYINDILFNLNLIGKFNVYNALAAICLGLDQEVSLNDCKDAIEKAQGIPGRMEEIYLGPFRVIVDYAFTPNALKKVYETLKTNSDIVCVLGACGGGRDKWKRKVLGGIASEYCRKVIITNEDPYDEDPMAIIEQVAEGVLNPIKILDRREAIKKALEVAQKGDVVVITGKGCEPWICVEKGKKIPWDDRKVVREEAQKLNIVFDKRT